MFAGQLSATDLVAPSQGLNIRVAYQVLILFLYFLFIIPTIGGVLLHACENAGSTELCRDYQVHSARLPLSKLTRYVKLFPVKSLMSHSRFNFFIAVTFQFC